MKERFVIRDVFPNFREFALCFGGRKKKKNENEKEKQTTGKRLRRKGKNIYVSKNTKTKKKELKFLPRLSTLLNLPYLKPRYRFLLNSSCRVWF